MRREHGDQYPERRPDYTERALVENLFGLPRPAIMRSAAHHRLEHTSDT